MLTAAVRDLHLSFPGQFQTDVRTSCSALWENNSYLTPLSEDDPEVEAIACEYPLIQQSNQLPYHFIHAFRLFLSERLGVDIRPYAFKGDIHLSVQEKSWMSQVDEITDIAGTRFWIIVSGGKTDFTAKWWDPARSQAVVDHFRDRVQFVQVGAAYDDHIHPPLEGVINLVGRTDLRQMVRLMYHADGVVCPVTMLMHLAAAVETKPGRPRNRPCVVVAGGREPSQWEAYPHHQYLHTNGMLPCCDDGGCWKSRVVPLGDEQEQDGSLCEYPVEAAPGRLLPACLDMITVEQVIDSVERYLRYGVPLDVYKPTPAGGGLTTAAAASLIIKTGWPDMPTMRNEQSTAETLTEDQGVLSMDGFAPSPPSEADASDRLSDIPLVDMLAQAVLDRLEAEAIEGELLDRVVDRVREWKHGEVVGPD